MPLSPHGGIGFVAATIVCCLLCAPDSDAFYYNTRYMMAAGGSCSSSWMFVQYDGAGYVSLSSGEPPTSQPYPSNVRCEATLDAGAGNRVYARFASVDTRPADSLALYSGRSADSGRYLGAVSGTYTAFTARTDGRYLTLSFTSGTGINYSHTGFKMIYTIFHSEPCSEFDYECENDYCISDSLTCDLIDNCGDDSDEDDEADCYDYGVGAGVLVGIVVAVLAAIGLIIASVVVCCVCAFRARSPARYHQTTVIHAGSPGARAPYPATGSGGAYGTIVHPHPHPPHYQQYDGHKGAAPPPTPPPPPYQRMK